MHYAMIIETEDPPSELLIDDLMYQFMEYHEDAAHPIGDYYVIGGRWNGDIPNNCCLGKNMPKDFVPYYFLTSDDVLYASGYNWGNFPNEQWHNHEEIFSMPSAFVAEYERAVSELVDHISLIDRHLFKRHYKIDESKWYTLLDIH